MATQRRKKNITIDRLAKLLETYYYQEQIALHARLDRHEE